MPETGTFHCRDCDARVRVKKGERLPDCPCGSSVYNRHTKEARAGSAHRKRKSAAKRSTARPENRTPASGRAPARRRAA